MGRVIRASEDGEVVYADGDKVIFKGSKKAKKEITYSVFFIPEELHRQQLIHKKQWSFQVKKLNKDDLLIDGPSSQNGELALRTKSSYCLCILRRTWLWGCALLFPTEWSEEDILSSIHIEKYEAAVVETKLGPEETTRDIIPNVSEEDLAKS